MADKDIEKESCQDETVTKAAQETDGTEQTDNTKEPDNSKTAENEKSKAADESQDASETDKKAFFKKKDKKDKKDEQIEELNDKVKRQMAEFDNFRKRTEREKAAMFEIGAKSVIEKILPVVDNFERGMSSVPEDKQDDPFVQGMDKIYRQLVTTLEALEVKPIEAVGKEFNPAFHNAVMHVEDENLDANIVAEEFQKGYMYRDSVIRHSMVKVAN